MADNVAVLRAKLVADTSQFLSALKRAQGGLSGVGKGFRAMSMAAMPLKLVGGLLKSVAGGLLRVGQIAAGIVLAQVFMKAAEAVRWFIKTALDSTEVMQRLGIQIQTLSARELSKSIDQTNNQAVNWRKASKESETLVFNVQMLRDAVAEYGDVILDVNPELRNIINSNKKFATVAVDVAKKWMSTSDVFDQSAGTAQNFINQLKRIAIISPFTVATTNTMFRLASALGFTQKQSVTVTKGMLDVAAGLGLTEEAAQRLILNFSQIRSQNKLTQRDIREMSLTGFQMADVFDEMNRTLGTNIKTNLDFNDALKTSQFTWEEFVNAFSSMADREFGESAKRMAFTIGGLKSTFKDVFLTTIPEILMPTAEMFGKFAEDAVENLLQLVESGELEEMGETLATTVGIWLGHIKTFVLRVGESGIGTALEGLAQAGGLPPIVAESFRNVGEALNTLDGLKDIVELFGQIERGSFDAFGRENLEGVGQGPMPVTSIPVEELLPGKNALEGPVNALLELWERLKTWWDTNGPQISIWLEAIATLFEGTMAGAMKALEPAVDDLTEAWMMFKENVDWDAVVLILGIVVGLFAALAVGGITVIAGLVRGLAGAFKALVQTAVDVKDGLTDIGYAIKTLFEDGLNQETITNLLTTVITTFTTFFGNLGNIVLEFIEGFINTIADVAGGIAEAFGQEIELVDVNLVEGWNTLKEGILNLITIGTGEIVKAGSAFIQGLWDGMKSAWSGFKTWLDARIADIPEAIRNFLGIHSPSSVMEGIGGDIMAGFYNGLTGASETVQIGDTIGIGLDTPYTYTGSNAGWRPPSAGAGAGPGAATQAVSAAAKVAVGVATQATQAAMTISAKASQEVGAMMAATSASSTNAQLASEAQTRGALVTKLDEVVSALQAQGNASKTASAIVEGLQTADF